ncbi:MAG: tRNA U34 5-methylaminomethyl-2-thiouridine-forming methyltransferase MnmC [Flavobacterium sp.]|jgi:tRNA U34 5-methylaminomethyl-2-thiouridine-forming methyltransferase MnmC
MRREIQITYDGSTTIFLPDMKEGYHSKFGAIQESEHVFIKNGLQLFSNQIVAILEMGFGTGLNALTTFLAYKKSNLTIDYVGVEAYPIEKEEVLKMNYCEKLNSQFSVEFYTKIHESNWNEKVIVSEGFSLTKLKQLFEETTFVNKFDLVYYDAFGFDAQPHLWEEDLFQKMYVSLKKNGVLVTYACRTTVKNAMINVGFSVEKLPGAPGKREMLRATKN